MSIEPPGAVPGPHDAEEGKDEEFLLDPSRRIERHELAYDEHDGLCFLGEGGCGEVFEATLKGERRVAVKVFKKKKRGKEGDDWKKWKKEVSILLRIEPHRFIIDLIGLCTAPRYYALVMAFVRGDLMELLTSDEEAVQSMDVRKMLAEQIADGMVHLHYHCPPVIHYDLKPSNVLVDKNKKDGEYVCKICDFGLSKMADDSFVSSYQSAESYPSGTVAYIAPERYRRYSLEGGARRVSTEEARKADVFSYGVLLWEIRERDRLYKGMPPSMIHFKSEQGAKLPDSRAASDAPPHYNRLIDTCTDSNPNVRPTFREVVSILRGAEFASASRVPASLESYQLPCQAADPHDAEQDKVFRLDPSSLIERDELIYDEADNFIGCGGFGEVYKATLRKGEKEQTVAVKVFRSFERRRNEKEYDDFKKEASILLRIKPHRFVVNLIGLCSAPRHCAIIMEFVSGGNLHDLLSSDDEAIQRMEVRLTIAKQIAIGMVHLHYHLPPVIHYNLKSNDVLVDKKGDDFICKICDFGLSKIADNSAVTSDQSAGSAPSGTVAYIAPERYRTDFLDGDGGARRVEIEEARKADVYSYGVLLWEIRERTRPYKGLPARVIHYKAEQGEKLPEGRAASEAPSYYNTLLEKCQDRDLGVRPTFQEVIRVLQVFCN